MEEGKEGVDFEGREEKKGGKETKRREQSESMSKSRGETENVPSNAGLGSIDDDNPTNPPSNNDVIKEANQPLLNLFSSSSFSSSSFSSSSSSVSISIVIGFVVAADVLRNDVDEIRLKFKETFKGRSAFFDVSTKGEEKGGEEIRISLATAASKDSCSLSSWMLFIISEFFKHDTGD